jgi:tetratricopeptide (TPR) repeat protein
VAEEEDRIEDARRHYEAARDLRTRIGYAAGAAESQLGLGGLLLLEGDPDAAREQFSQARRAAEQAGAGDWHVLALAHLAALPGGSVAEAESLFAREEETIGVPQRVEVHYLLWRATGEAKHLEVARDLLSRLAANAPERYRTTLRENVRLHREVEEAAQRHAQAPAELESETGRSDRPTA